MSAAPRTQCPASDAARAVESYLTRLASAIESEHAAQVALGLHATVHCDGECGEGERLAVVLRAAISHTKAVPAEMPGREKGND